MREPRGFMTVLWVLAFAGAGFAAASAGAGAGADDASAEGARAIKASMLIDPPATGPGGTFTVAVHLKIAPHWHTYWINPGSFGDAIQIELRGPKGIEFGDIQWPLPHRIPVEGGVSFGYEDEVVLLVPAKVAAGFKPQKDVKIEGDVSWMVCRADACVPGEAKIAGKVSVRPQPGQTHAEGFADWQAQLPVKLEQASGVIAGVSQPGGESMVSVQWKTPPRDVEWFPVATAAVAIEDIQVKHEGGQTVMTFKPVVFDPDAAGDGRLNSVLVYRDDKGQRRGVEVPFSVKVKKVQ